MKKPLILLLVAGLATPRLAPADERVDLDAVARIRAEGLSRGQGMDTIASLCDDIGGRLTGSPNMKKAAAQVKARLLGMGLADVRLVPIPERVRGFSVKRVTLRMVSPALAPLAALAKAWTPGTNGPKKAQAVLAKLEKDEDFAALKGRLEGKIVLLGKPRDWKAHETLGTPRLDQAALDGLAAFEPGLGPFDFPHDDVVKLIERFRKLREFLTAEKVLATIEPSNHDDGTIAIQGTYDFLDGQPMFPPALVVPAESYGRLARLVERKKDVELELDVENVLGPPDPEAAASVLGDLPGTDRKDEIVMLGAHLDSWHGATGATDDAFGVATVIEAVRILKAAGLTPRRTIRVALWTGEEQGLLGSQHYVDEHLATRPEPSDPVELGLPRALRNPTSPLSLRAEQARHSVYFNVDNGAGRVRGIYLQENTAARPVFEAFLAPLKDLGAATITLRNTTSTDHMPFDGAGVPAFQLVQDPLDYLSRTHHTSLDNADRVPKADLDQASTVLATLAYLAATRDELIPRKALPKDAVVPPRGDANGSTPGRSPGAPATTKPRSSKRTPS